MVSKTLQRALLDKSVKDTDKEAYAKGLTDYEIAAREDSTSRKIMRRTQSKATSSDESKSLAEASVRPRE